MITGSTRGIGGATATLFNQQGCNVIIVDLPSLQQQAERLIQSLKYPDNAIFVAASVTEWKQMVHVFKQGLRRFSRIDIVVANAGLMESQPVLDVVVDDDGDPVESKEASTVIDVNLKGTLNSEFPAARLNSWPTRLLESKRSDWACTTWATMIPEIQVQDREVPSCSWLPPRDTLA